MQIMEGVESKAGSQKDDASKVTEAKAKKISSLEKELVNLKKAVQNLTDKNAILESEKAKRDEIIEKLNARIYQLNNSHVAEVNRLNTKMEKLKKKLAQWYDIEDLDLESLDPTQNVEEYLR
ncbi:hypothetical protein LXL04_012118 [Taraxacum kok-saghyz]